MCKEHLYYKNYEAKRRESGKGARIKFKLVRREVKKFIKKNPEYRGLVVLHRIVCNIIVVL